MVLNDIDIPVKRLQLDLISGSLVPTQNKSLFIKGPIPMDWVEKVAKLPGKALNVAMAICWLHGMAKGKPIKLTKKALNYLNVSRDAAGDAVKRLEEAGLIHATRSHGRCHVVSVLFGNPSDPQKNKTQNI